MAALAHHPSEALAQDGAKGKTWDHTGGTRDDYRRGEKCRASTLLSNPVGNRCVAVRCGEILECKCELEHCHFQLRPIENGTGCAIKDWATFQAPPPRTPAGRTVFCHNLATFGYSSRVGILSTLQSIDNQ